MTTFRQRYRARCQVRACKRGEHVEGKPTPALHVVEGGQIARINGLLFIQVVHAWRHQCPACGAVKFEIISALIPGIPLPLPDSPEGAWFKQAMQN